MIFTEGLTPTGRKKLDELVADLDRELQIAGSLVSAHGKRSQAERVETALNNVAALQKKVRSDVFAITSAMITEDIATGRTPSRSVSEIVAAAEEQSLTAAAAALSDPQPVGPG